MSRYGLNFFPTVDPATMPIAVWYDDCLELARLADELGFNSVRTVERHGRTYGGYCPNPILLLTALARCTTRLRVQTGAVVPAFHHPVRLAEDLSMLDHLSHGRLDVGFARAFIPSEFELFGDTPGSRTHTGDHE
jgi:alkanesulfonate monooxygenase SsuD/methylene tetrahydromethanopterin reductase-like flavin-dependent oxidoreductase (luciferase family)